MFIDFILPRFRHSFNRFY